MHRRFILLVAFLVACGGGSGGGSGVTRQAACENVCGCIDFSDPADAADCVISCTNSSSSGIELTSQECIDCAAAASCVSINDGTACTVECDDPSSSSMSSMSSM